MPLRRQKKGRSPSKKEREPDRGSDTKDRPVGGNADLAEPARLVAICRAVERCVGVTGVVMVLILPAPAHVQVAAVAAIAAIRGVLGGK